MPRCLRSLSKGGRRLVDVVGLAAKFFRQADVVVPAAVEQLHEAHIPLHHPPRQQAVACERAALLHLGTVHLEDVFGLPGQVGQLGHRGLHAERHLLLGDRRLDLRVADLRRGAPG